MNKSRYRVVRSLKKHGIKFSGYSHRSHRTNKTRTDQPNIKKKKLQKIKDKEFKQIIKDL